MGEFADWAWEEERVANNAPKYDYRCRRCGYTDESHINEQLIWSCPVCYENPDETGERLFPLYKLFRSPSVWTVWHGHECQTTGKWITDRKQFKRELKDASDIATQRLGMEHHFIEVDPSDRDSLHVTDEGLDATHDAHVRMGIKQSKGQFVFPMGERRKYTSEKPSS